MEHLYHIEYIVDGQEETLDVITESETLAPEEAYKRVKAAVKPYGKTNVESINIVKVQSAEVIDTDPQTSASE